MMLRRRIPSASPGARGSLARKPSSSGPRCWRAADMARTRASASDVRLANAAPQIPHTLLLDLRCSEELYVPRRVEDQMFSAEHGQPRERDYDTRLSTPTSWRYSDSIFSAGSSHPSRDV